MKWLAGSVVVAAMLMAQAHASVVFSFSNSGIVAPTDPVACADPFAGCSLTAIGSAMALPGNVATLPGPWSFTATFSIVAPLSATTFHTTGTFLFDDTSAADNDIFGALDGVLDSTTFQNSMTYLVSGGRGMFLGLGGSGSSLIQIVPQGPGQPFSFSEQGQLVLPEPNALHLSLLALAAAICFAGTAHGRRTLHRGDSGG